MLSGLEPTIFWYSALTSGKNAAGETNNGCVCFVLIFWDKMRGCSGGGSRVQSRIVRLFLGLSAGRHNAVVRGRGCAARTACFCVSGLRCRTRRKPTDR